MLSYLTKLRNKKGFTLIEVVIVVAIIAIMTAVAVPNILTSNRRAEARKHNDHARAFYLAVHQTLSNTMQTDNTDQEFSLTIGSTKMRRATGAAVANTIVGQAATNYFFLYAVMGDNGDITTADLTYGTETAYTGSSPPTALATYTKGQAAPAAGTNNDTFQKLIQEIMGYSSTASSGNYFVMFDTKFRVIMAYYSRNADRATVRAASYAFGKDNTINNRIFGAYPREYSFVGKFKDGAGVDRDRVNGSGVAGGAWFGNDNLKIIPNI